MRQPEHFDIEYNLDASHPDANDFGNKLPTMPYLLDNKDDDNENDMDYDNERDPLVPRQQKGSNKEVTDPFKVANKQERLFCCGKFGTNCLIINLL